MNHRVSVVLAVFSLIAVSTVRSQEGGALVVAETPVFCSASLQVLRAEIMALWEPMDVVVYINCLAFGQERTLESGIVSAFPADGTPGTRYTISCQNNAITVRESTQPATRFNLTAQAYTACTECADVAAAADICPADARCPLDCERCAVFPGNNVLCTVCNVYGLLNAYPIGAVPNAELIERQRERLEANGQEEVCMDNPVINVESATSFTCVETCPVMNGLTFQPSVESRTCYACGLEYCVECDGNNRCTACLDSTVLFDGECFSCPLALVARTAIVQEEEERSEIAIQRTRQIELAVALPIVSLLVIVVFISLSIYAHHRYPHISYQGHKRHRTKQDVFTTENNPITTPPPTGEEPLSDSDVWRARPSIRFR